MLLAELLLGFILNSIISINITLTSWLFHPTPLTYVKFCDSGVVFELFVAVSPLVKRKNWSH